MSLEPHPQHRTTDEGLIELVRELREANPDILLAADLFCGAGGLSLGLRDAGIETVLAVDHYKEAVQTHRHHFAGLTVDWDLAEAGQVERVARLMSELDIDVLAGGPPCQPFSKAGRSGIRYRVHHGLRDPHDERRDLWRSFLEVAQLARPRAVIMENVPDMALDEEMFILRSMVEELEDLGYAVKERIVDTSEYGVPQFRQRLILVALRDGLDFEWPEKPAERVMLGAAIGDLPPVKGGWQEHGTDRVVAYGGPSTDFQRRARLDVPDEQQGVVFDHITRQVRRDDKAAFESMTSDTKYSDLDQEYRRYRADIFDDKYKRLDNNQLSRTITAHIAKDGYWYIHPTQSRTLTIREAARIQTFPDWYRFAGPPTAALKQIGNAVPPRAAEHLGKALRQALSRPTKKPFDTRHVARTLDGWFAERPTRAVPWLRASNRWQAICGELLLDRAESQHVRLVWRLVEGWKSPQDTLAMGQPLRKVGELSGRSRRVEELLTLAERLTSATPSDLGDDVLDEATLLSLLPESVRQITRLIAPSQDGDEPVLINKGVLRPVRRFLGKEEDDRRNERSEGRLAIARMVGGGTTFRGAHLGLIELANSLCRPVDPVCSECPLLATCAEGSTRHDPSAQLF